MHECAKWERVLAREATSGKFCESAQPPTVRGTVGQRADDWGGQGGGDGINRGHHAEGDDLVVRRDVLQLEREHDLRRRLVRHPHAQAGQGEGDDPADPHMLSRFGQGERLHVLLTDHLICHGWIMTHPGRLAIVDPRSLAPPRVVSGMEAWEVRRR